MKKCPYCGKEYPDEVTLCAVDQNLLSKVTASPPANVQQGAVEKNKPSYLVFPDYKWTALDAWKCLGVIVVLEFVASLVFRGLYLRLPAFGSWFAGPIGYLSSYVFLFVTELLVAVYFARTETPATFWKAFGFNRKPSHYVLFGVAAAFAISLFRHIMVLNGFGKGVPRPELHLFRITPGVERYLFLVPTVILAPVLEEPIYRGFLYKAFRGSYSILPSVLLIVAWTAMTHWPQYSHSLLAAFDLSVLTVIQCYLREKSDSLWDCIFCHLIFNSSSLIVSGILRY
jgi:membrane protease YdiL (CAAX protease family)